MAGNLIGEPFKDYVNEQIKARQKVHGKTERTLEEISYLNSRNAWIKMASGVTLSADKYNDVTKDIDTPSLGKKQNDDGGLLAKNWVLFNGLGKPKNSNSTDNKGRVVNNISATNPILGDRAGIGENGAYGIGGNKFGYAPMPGITDASLKCLNRGSIKKMEVNVIAHNTNQFNVIDTLYLRLGYSVFIEWGYDKYLDNNGDLQSMGASLIDEKFFSSKFNNSNYSKWIPEIEKKRKETNGNYEGIFGTISNFSWTFQDDGSYKIKIEIISLGDIVESLKANLPAVGKLPSAYAQVRLESLKELFIGGAPASKDDFYNKLFPGLKQLLIDYYTTLFNSTKNSLVKVTYGDRKETNNPNEALYASGLSRPLLVEFVSFDLEYKSPQSAGESASDEKVIFENLQKGIFYAFQEALKERSDSNTVTFNGITTTTYEGRYLVKKRMGALNQNYFNVEGTFSDSFYRPINNDGVSRNFSPSAVTPTTPSGGVGFPDRFADDRENSGLPRHNYVFDVDYLLDKFYEYAKLNDFAGGDKDIRFSPTGETTEGYADGKGNKNRILKYFSNIDKYFRKRESLFFSLISTKLEPSTNLESPKGVVFPIGKDNIEAWNKEISFPKFKLTPSRDNALSFCKFEIPGFYIKLGTFLDFLQEEIIPKIEKGSQPVLTIDTNREANICYSPGNVISLNPNKIIIRNQSFYRSNGKYSIINKGLRNYKYSTADGKYIYGTIMNVYFSFKRLEEIFDNIDSNGNISIYTVLKTICQDINESLGYVNNIEPVISENNKVKFIDQTPIPGIEKIVKEIRDKYKIKDFNLKTSTPAILEVFGYNKNNNTSTFVNKIGITTEINKNYATMITIGATSNGSIPGVEATAFSKWNLGIKDRFKNNILDAQNPSTPKTPLDSIVEQNEGVIKAYSDYLELNSGLMGYNEGEDGTINDNIIDINNKTVSNFYKYQSAYSSLTGSREDSVSSVGFMPFNLKLDMDGLGGIKIYNKITVNTSFLPPNYGKSLEFIITGVNHKISNNSWETHLDTIATSKSIPNPQIIIPTKDLIPTSSADYSLIIASCPTTVVSGWEVPATFNGTTLNTTIKRKNVTPNASVKRDIVPIINGSDYKSKYTLGHRILAMVTVLKEGYNETYSDNPLGTKAYRTKNPGNIGNTDSGNLKTLSSVKEGMELVMEYYSKRNKGTGFTDSQKIWNFGPQKIRPNFSKEIQENLANYGNPPNGCTPGYEGNYQGEISYFAKRYSTASRINNSGLSRFKTLFELNGYTNFTTSSKIQDLMAFGGKSNKDIKFS